MSNIEDYNSLMEKILNIPENRIVSPGIPMEIFHQEADDLEHWSRNDREKLQANGLREEYLTTLPVRINASREAQAIWNEERQSQQDAQVLWKDTSPKGYELRDHLNRSFRYAFRKYPKLLASLDRIAEGDSHADMIQDLINLSVIGRKNKPLLEAINFDLNLLEHADAMGTELGDLLAEVNGERRSENATKILRDRYYTHLKEAVDEIRACGRYVFWNNENRLQGYHSHYYKKMSSKYRARQKEHEQEA